MNKNLPFPDHVTVADAWFALPRSQRGYKLLAAQLRLPDTKATLNHLARMVREAEERGLVHHVVLRNRSELRPRNPRLEAKLRHQFALRQAIVVNISNPALSSTRPELTQETWNNFDDELHEHLGAWAARVLTSCLRSGDKIATGGGRGPYYTVLKSNVSTPHRYSGDILPLTGQISARSWHYDGDTDGVPPYLDADNVASQLHFQLGSSGRLLSLYCPITEMKRPPRTDDVDVAIFGIGALGGGHRLKNFEQLDDIRRVRPLLRDINALAEAVEQKTPRAGSPFFHAIGDVCNCYFVVEPETGRRAEKEWRELDAKVRQLNAAFKSATPEALGRIARRGMVLAVAGGPHKAHAIRHVLRNNRDTTWITHLVTDHETARWILQQEKDAGQHAPAPPTSDADPLP